MSDTQPQKATCHGPHREPYFVYSLQGNGLTLTKCQSCGIVFQAEADGKTLWRDPAVKWFTEVAK